MTEARAELAGWLGTARAQRGLSLDDIARVTKIQVRTLERIEQGQLDGLPAEVFVRGFIRSFAKCLGLDEAEAVRRYQSVSAGGNGSAASSVSAPVVLHGIAARPRANTMSGTGIGAQMPGLPAPASPGMATGRAVIAAMADLAPTTARASSQMAAVQLPIEIVDVSAPIQLAAASHRTIPMQPKADDTIVEAVAEAVAPAAPAKAKRKRTSKKVTADAATSAPKRTRRSSLANGTPTTPTPVVVEVPAAAIAAIEASEAAVERPVYKPDPTVNAFVEVVAAPVATAAVEDDGIPEIEIELSFGEGSGDGSGESPVTAPWQPTMPPLATQSSVPWRSNRPIAPRVVRKAAAPSLVIDDADPDSAERLLAAREERQADRHGRRSFLPPILLDREDRSARQGGLTLAVIILLIAATLTLSYLMRRPSSSGDGYTMADDVSQTLG